MTKTDIQILRGARNLIADELDWTQGTLARDYRGESCALSKYTPHQRCAAGAVLWSSEHIVGALDCNPVLRHLRDHFPPDFEPASWAGDSPVAQLANFNDTSSHAAVLALYDRAIEAAEETT